MNQQLREPIEEKKVEEATEYKITKNQEAVIAGLIVTHESV